MALYAQKQKTECIYIFYLGWEQKTTSGCLFFFLPKLKKMRLRMNAPAISRPMVREISTSISLFVIVLKMHYSSQVKKKKKKVLCFLSQEDLVFFKKSYFFLYSLLYMNQSSSLLIFLSLILLWSTLSVFVKYALLASFVVTTFPQAFYWSVLVV